MSDGESIAGREREVTFHTSSALTREQVEEVFNAVYWHGDQQGAKQCKVLDGIDALRATIEQQAQELERLKREFVNKDQIIASLAEQLAASQARWIISRCEPKGRSCRRPRRSDVDGNSHTMEDVMSDDGDCCYPVTGYPTPAMTDHAQRAREIVSHFKISIKNAEGGMILEFNQDGMTSLVEDALAQAHAAGRREGLEEAHK